jgi:hypothetical protein
MSEDRFIFVPLRLRREHRDWPNAEHAAWFDLFLASFEVPSTSRWCVSPPSTRPAPASCACVA